MYRYMWDVEAREFGVLRRVWLHRGGGAMFLCICVINFRELGLQLTVK